MLRRADGALAIEDVSGRLPGLQYRPGRTQWALGWRSKSKSSGKGRLLQALETRDNQEKQPSQCHEDPDDPDGDEAQDDAERHRSNHRMGRYNDYHQWFKSYDEVPFQLQGDRIQKAMFPSGIYSDSLRHCMRLVPLDQDTGGFFICVVKKVQDLPGPRQCGLPPIASMRQLPPPGYVCRLCHTPDHHFVKQCPKFPDQIFDDAQHEQRSVPVQKKPKTEHTTQDEEMGEMPYRPIPDTLWTWLRDFYQIQDSTLKVRAKHCTHNTQGLRYRDV